MPETIDERIEELRKQTGFPEEVVGCFLSNYKQKYACPIATNGWCNDLMKCRNLESMIGGKIKCTQV